VSWSRFGDSDIYTFPSDRGYECCACSLNAAESYTTRDVAEFLAHITRHRAAGDDVPAEIETDVRAWAGRWRW